MNKIHLIEAMTTWQGEGPDSGKRMLLLRFKKCNRVLNNKACFFCDTIVRMHNTLEVEHSFESIKKVINDEKCDLMITGGEPTYGDNYNETVNLIKYLGHDILINIETNGFFLNALIKDLYLYKNVNYIFSPKIFDRSDFDDCKSIVDEINKSGINHNLFIKLVYLPNPDKNIFNDLFLKTILHFYPTLNKQIYLMPEGKTKKEVINNSPIVFDKAEEFKVNFSSRSHVIYNFI